MKNTVVPTTKKLLGTLALIGLMSVVLAKFFSDLAFADDLSTLPTPASLTENSQYLGEYEVKQDVPSELNSNDPDCGKKVWVYRSSEGKLVLLDAVDIAQDQLNMAPAGGTIGKSVAGLNATTPTE